MPEPTQARPEISRSHAPPSRVRWRPHALDVLLAGGPVAVLAEALHWNAVVLFFASGLAIVPLARYIGVSTEELAGHVGPALGGLLNATFGNATELIIAFLALQAGLYEVVKASLVGSILGNILAVLGLSFLVGGWKRDRQAFNRTAASAAGAQLTLAGGAILVPAVLAATSPVSHTALSHLSIMTAAVLLVAYGAGLYFTLRTHAHLFTEEQERMLHGGTSSVRLAIVVLLISTVLVAGLSELLVDGVKGVTAHLGWTQMFIGVILIALLGNAAEHLSAVTAAKHDQMDLALSIALGSATQIALFVAPVLVVIGSLTGHPLDLLFDTFEVVVVIIAIGLANLLIADGESTWLEGMQLLAVYVILAAAFFVHP
ncbi:MAG TPA: calcium/proton exchanger [Chloroflexota bacterium]|nr:calcium/proton exchanger [Chloroflexota bacterium]